VAEQLLAVAEQHVLLECVLDLKLGHSAGLVDLRDAEAERQRLVERDVSGARHRSWKGGQTTMPRCSTGSPS
jgi:hypothetical protein